MEQNMFTHGQSKGNGLRIEKGLSQQFTKIAIIHVLRLLWNNEITNNNQYKNYCKLWTLGTKNNI